MIAKFSSVISEDGGNIITLVNKSKGEYAYSVIDIDKVIPFEDIKNVNGVLRVRVI
jgi:D-3-phosphoglycerate dehydrogenase